MTLLDRYVLAGGLMMIFILPAAVMTLAYIIQGFVNLRRSRLCPKGFAENIWRAGYENRKSTVQNLRAQSSAIAEIVLKATSNAEALPAEDPAVLLREQIAEAADRLHHENSHLGLIYRIGPLMGLVGTVFGMIRTFTESSFSNEPDLKQLSAGVMVALTSTAWGVGMAFPAYFFLFFFQRRISHFEKFDFVEEGELALHVLLDRPVGSSMELARRRGLLA